ncbi:hypothetical protein G5S52_06265 [Grimontia sp. S25]|uniref:Uncharacterized protein n=1 Tax=Grimontia sedimenti TaxID=2711294 RepID=A0A6M1RAW3_9GAMM|nr:hypothetical protein [Grimontia sedimenti]NGN97276.1 hypothetical protein [Grimontia sedimenti]
MSWFLCSFNWTKNRCVDCGVLHEFTGRRKLVTGLTVFLAIIGMQLLGAFVHASLALFLAGCVFAFSIIAIFPGQHQLDSKDKLNIAKNITSE